MRRGGAPVLHGQVGKGGSMRLSLGQVLREEKAELISKPRQLDPGPEF